MIDLPRQLETTQTVSISFFDQRAQFDGKNDMYGLRLI